MTDEELKAARALADRNLEQMIKVFNNDPRWSAAEQFHKMFMESYAAGCESKRAQIKRLRSALAFTACCAKSGESHKIDEVVAEILAGKRD